MKKRLLSAFLIFCLILTFSSFWAFASDTESASEDHSGYTELTSSTSSTLSEGSYYLSSDVTLTSNITVSGTVTLDLNGHTLIFNTSSSSSSDSNNYITVNDGASLTIKDCQASGITQVEESELPSSVYSDSNNDGTKEFTASTIRNTSSADTSTYTGTFTTYFSATITNEITGETTTTYYSYTSGGIYGSSPSSANTDRAVYVSAGGAFTLEGGTITGFYKTGDTNDNSSKNGSAIYCAGTFNMTGGAVSGNKISGGYGGAVSVNCGTLNMSGGVISGNTAAKVNNNNSGKGGALYVYGTASNASDVENGTANITGGYITNNSSQRSGGAIYIDDAKVVIGTKDSTDNSAVVISNNTGSTGGTGDGGGAIYICGNTTRTGIAQLYIYSGYISNNISCAAYAGGIAAGDSDSYIYMYGGAITGNIAQKSSSDTKKGGGVGIIGGTMSMYGGYISYNTASERGGGVCVGNGGSSDPGSFTMSGGYITNNKALITGGGGIWIDGATVSITGGTITGNSAATYGGGIYVDQKSNTGSLSVTGGVVANNTAAEAAADIYADSGVSLTLNGPSDTNAVNADTIYGAESCSHTGIKIDGWYIDGGASTTDSDGNTTTPSRYSCTTTETAAAVSMEAYTASYTASTSSDETSTTLSCAAYIIAAHGTPYTLTYDGNALSGGTAEGVPDLEYYTSGSTAILSSTVPVHTDVNGQSVVFKGWSAEKTDEIYDTDDEITGLITQVTFEDSDITVYAVWQYAAEEETTGEDETDTSAAKTGDPGIALWIVLLALALFSAAGSGLKRRSE